MTKFGRHNIRASKLTPDKVLDIRVAYDAGATQGSLARLYGMSIGQIGRIVRGESWNQYQQIEPARDPELEHALALQRLAAHPLPPDRQTEAALSLARFKALLAEDSSALPADSLPPEDSKSLD